MDDLIEQGIKVDMILCDLPYGQTKNKWDSVIPFDQLWSRYKKLIKDRGVIALFGQGMFTAELMLSQKKMWRYNLIWDKVMTSGFLNANRQPLRSHEDIVVFYKKAPQYNPQKVKGEKCHSRGSQIDLIADGNKNYGEYKIITTEGDMKHPKSILTFPRKHASIMTHPTEKAVGICEWLIKSYTNEGQTVLDNCMGSGTTGVACVNTNRRFIGIELDPNYFDIAKERIYQTFEQNKSIRTT